MVLKDKAKKYSEIGHPENGALVAPVSGPEPLTCWLGCYLQSNLANRLVGLRVTNLPAKLNTGVFRPFVMIGTSPSSRSLSADLVGR